MKHDAKDTLYHSTLSHPIGIFDSGVGGLCVLKEIRKLLPNESIVYFGDSHNCPYGEKTEEDALTLARKNIEFLIKHHCKIVVIACNTVTAIAINRLRSDFHIPFIGMEPALKPAALQTKTKKIGILATENTFNGNHFKQTYSKYGKDIEVYIQPGYGLVELVERNDYTSEKAKMLLEEYLKPMMDKGADTIVLGCTHYPFLKELIQEITCNEMNVIDPSNAVASQTKRVLEQLNLIETELTNPKFQFFTTGNEEITKAFLNDTVTTPYDIRRVTI